jgi:periplasmic protein TonB
MTVAVYTFEPDRRGEALRWTTGAAIILLAHTAFITSYIMLRQSSSNAPAEVPAISIDFSPPEVALPLPAPPVEEQKPEEVAPPPPQAEEAKIPPPPEEATPQAEPPPPPKQAELEQPQDKPVAPPPPVIEKPHIEKKIEKPKTATPAKTPPTPKAAHRTAPVAPSAGAPSAASVASQADWHGLLRTQLLRNKRYPSAAASNHETGSVVVSFTLDRSGHLLSRNVVRSSGHPSLDQEALATVERSQPLPSPPAGISQASLHITVPLNFTLR